MSFTSTPRGARLARRLVSHRLAEWGHPYDAEVNETATLVAAELTANAVRHACGHSFRLRLTLVTAPDEVVRVEVSDGGARAVHGVAEGVSVPDPYAESGRGLPLVARLAERWAVVARGDGAPGGTVWAEVAVHRRTRPGRVQPVGDEPRP